jgi:hypothetical protein
MDKDTLARLCIFAGTIGLVLAGLGILLAAFHLGAHAAATGIVVGFQMAFTVIGIILSVAVSCALACWVVFATRQTIIERLAKLEREHAQLMKKVRKQTPLFATAVMVIAEAVKVINDQAFEDEKMTGLVMSLGLLILFWIANQWVFDSRRWVCAGGLLLWFTAIASVPVTVMLVHGWSPSELYWKIDAQLEIETKISLIIVIAALVIIPFGFKNARE